jgi:hypothetical protein
MEKHVHDRGCHIRSDPCLPLNFRGAGASYARSNDRDTLSSGGRCVVGSVWAFSRLAGTFSKPMEELRHVLGLHSLRSLSAQTLQKTFAYSFASTAPVPRPLVKWPDRTPTISRRSSKYYHRRGKYRSKIQWRCQRPNMTDGWWQRMSACLPTLYRRDCPALFPRTVTGGGPPRATRNSLRLCPKR